MSSWKNEGGNRVNNIVNARTDITNKYFNTDPTIGINDREGIFFNKENSATVLGIGTKEPYSRFSFGDYILNNYSGNILKSESLVNTPCIALSEKNNGTNATGISFFYDRAGSGDSRGIRFTVNNNSDGTIFNSSLEPEAISDNNTLMLMTNDGRTNSVLINTTSTNFANPKSGLEINGEIRATQGIILKALDSTTIDRQAGLIFYDINDRKIKWCTGSGDDIKSVVVSGEDGFVIDTSKYDASFAIVENLATGTGVLAFKDIGFAIGNGTMLETKYVGSNQQNAAYLRHNIPAFSIIGKTLGEDDYNANMILSHIDYIDGTPILSGTSESDLSMNGVLYLLNNLAIDVFNPTSILDISKNMVPFLNIGANNKNYNNSLVVGCDLSGSKQSFYFGENILNKGSIENKFNLFFGKDITNFGSNNNNNFVFGNSNNINFSNCSNNLVFGNALNLENDVSFCLVMGTNGTVNTGDLIVYFQEGIGEVFSVRNGGNVYNRNSLGIGTKNPDEMLDVRGNIKLGDGSTSQQALKFITDEGNWQVGSNNLGNGTNGNQLFISDVNSSSTYMTIQRGTGNIGIGTDSPNAKLHVSHNENQNNGEVTIRSEGTIRTYAFNDDLYPRSEITNHDTGGKMQLFSGTTTSSTDVLLSAIPNDINYINNGGNFGIGTNSPNEILTVKGNIKAGGDNISSIQLWNGVNDYVYLYSEVGNGKIILKDQFSGDSNRNKILISANGDTYFNGGNVGILNNSPNYALDISGTGDIFIQGDNQIIYFKDTNNSISRENDKIVLKTVGLERLSIDELGTTRIKGLLSIDDLVISGEPFDAQAAASWNSTSSVYRSISVNFGVGINHENTSSTYRNFFPRYTFDVSGNIRGHNLFLGEDYTVKIIPENFTTTNYQDIKENSITVGLYITNEKKQVSTNPAWHLFDGIESSNASLINDSIEEIEYITMTETNEDYQTSEFGAYVEIFLPKVWSFSHYSFSYNSSINSSKLPKKWILLGKSLDVNDQNIDQITNKWKLIDEKEYPTNWTSDLGTDVYKKIFTIGEHAYNKEKFVILRLVILETYEESASSEDTTNFQCLLSGFQIYGTTSDLRLQNNLLIQSTFNDSDISDINKDIVLQPYGNNVGIGNFNPEVILDISNNTAIRLPAGTTDEGNALSNIIGDKKGYIRFNTTKNQFEGYLGKNLNDEPIWRGLGGLVDTDLDTYITPEETDGENSLKFYTNGQNRLSIDENGSIDISSNILDISATVLHIDCKSFVANKLDISNNLIVLNDLSSNKIFSKNIYLSERTIRNSDIIKATHPEDSQDDLFKLTTREGIFNITEDEDEGYYINDVLHPTIHTYPGSFIQFNLDLEVETFNLYVGNETNVGESPINVSGIVFIDENFTVSSGPNANGKLKGTLFWHIPYDAEGIFRYESGVTSNFKGTINVLPLPSDINNKFIVTNKLNTIDISGTNAEFNDISNNYLISNLVDSKDISANKIICYDKIGINYATPNVSLYIEANDSIKLPVGNDSERPPGDFGLLRYNDESKQFEGCDGVNWSGLGGVISVDQETTITAQDNTFGQDGIGSLIFTIDNEEGMRIMGGSTGERRRIGVNTATPSVVFDINDTGAIKIPVGTTQQGVDIETSSNPGYIRYNSQKNQLEGYDGSSWFSIAGPLSKQIDTDQDTYISVEETPGDNTVRFYSTGVERMTIANNGNINLTENLTLAKSLTSDYLNTEMIKLGSKIIKNSDMIKRANPEDTVEDFFMMKSNIGFFDVIFDEDEGNYTINDVVAATIYAYPGNTLEFNLINTETNGFRIFKGYVGNTTGTDADGLMHLSDDKTIVTDDFSNKNSGILVWNIPFDAIGNYRYQSEFSNGAKGDIIILPRISDISSNHILANEIIIHNDLSGNNAMLHDVSVNRLWIGQVEMIGYIPGNVENPMGLGELVGDFKVTEHTMLQSLDISKNINIDYSSFPNSTALTLNGSSGTTIPQVQFMGSQNALRLLTNNNSSSNYALSIASSTDETFIVKNNGCVGIGMEPESSDSRLQVELSTSNRVHFHTSVDGGGGAGLMIGDTYNHSITPMYYVVNEFSVCKTGTINNCDLSILTNSEHRIYIKKDGKVGINTTEAEETLDVRGNMRLGDGSTSQQALKFRTDEGNWQIGSNNLGNGTNGNQLFITDLNATSLLHSPTYITIQRGTGRIGIGTSSPTAKLQVNGAIKIKQDDTVDNNSTKYDKGIMFESPSGVHNYYMGYGNGESFTIGQYHPGASTIYNEFFRADGGLIALDPDNDGNVAIGKTSANNKLDVAGGITSDSLFINTGGSITLPWEGEIKVSSDLTHKKVFTTGETQLHSSAGGGNYINFSVAGNHSDNIDAIMRLSQYGYIGICNDRPQQKLDIKGNGSSIAAAPNIRFTNTDGFGRNWKIGPLRSGNNGFQINCSDIYGSSAFNTGMFQVDINGQVSIGTVSPSNTKTGLTIHNALGGENDAYTLHHQHTTQIRITNGQGTSSSRALEIGLLNSGRGIIQANESGFGYNPLDLNPGGGIVSVGRESSTNNSGLYIDGYHTRTDNQGALISLDGTNFYTSPIRFTPAWFGLDGDTATQNREKMAISTDYTIFTKNVIISSDKRIKKNIIEVPDNMSLYKLRNIECKYYNYIDTFNRGSNKIIGFIAQQVREYMPEAISIVNNFIPNVHKLIENPSWSTVDISENDVLKKKYKITINDFNDPSDNTYKFYVSNDGGINETTINTKCTDNNSFIFDNSWNNVIIYGKEVDDFHTLDKQKLFTLNFSATQEIDRIQQNEKNRLDEANNKIAILEEKNKQLESTLEQVMKRLDELENN